MSVSVTMASPAMESLFSLEVVVDSLAITAATCPCRFPAVAFRFLDYPTLLVTHVEPPLSDTIKSKLCADPLYKVPAQLVELQDKNGRYVIKKGKSCLFRNSADMLLKHLTSTPLYVIVTDTYPEVPRLIGNCTIPLDETMNVIYDDICKLGITVPAVHAGKGNYNIFNLMGSKIGSISLGYRLLSLGPGLLSHIPEQAIAKPVADIGPADLGDITTSVNIDTSAAVTKHDTPKHANLIKQTQTELHVCKMPLQAFETSTQTEVTKPSKYVHSKHAQKELVVPSEEPNDLFISNTVCPPPLFYNSKAEAQYTCSGAELVEPFTDDESLDEGTIRLEDKFDDSEFDVHDPCDRSNWEQVFAKIKQHEPTKLPDENKTSVNKKRNMAAVINQPTMNVARSLSELPLLSALVTEIMSLQLGSNVGVSRSAGQVDECVGSSRPSHSSQSLVAPSKSSSLHQQLKINAEEFLARMTAPKNPAEPIQPSNRMKPCVSSTGGTQRSRVIPKNKSWIRQQPTVNGICKTKLAYGMTNTQRLRLAKGNPKLLETLEKQEQERLQKWRAHHKPKWPQSQPNVNQFGMTRNFPPGEVGMSQLPIVSEEGDHALAHTGESTDSKVHRKPVPTPRLSISLKNKHDGDNEGDGDTNGAGDIRQRNEDIVQEMSAEEVHNEMSDCKDEPNNYDVYVPTASAEDDNSDVTSMCSSLGSQMSMDRKTVSGPQLGMLDRVQYNSQEGTSEFDNIPPDGTADSGTMPRGLDTQGSFDNSAACEPELQRIVESYSDSSTDSKPSRPQSHMSTKSFLSSRSENIKLKIPSVPNPAASAHSPVSAVRLPSMAMREPLVASSSTTADDPAAMGSVDSTAYITRSQMHSSQWSADSHMTGLNGSGKVPARAVMKIERKDSGRSVRTESVSSYAPSDHEDMSPTSAVSPLAEYTDSFEESEADEVGLATMSDLKLASQARFGYTT